MVFLSKTEDVKEQNLCKVKNMQIQSVSKGVCLVKIIAGIKLN